MLDDVGVVDDIGGRVEEHVRDKAGLFYASSVEVLELSDVSCCDVLLVEIYCAAFVLHSARPKETPPTRHFPEAVHEAEEFL